MNKSNASALWKSRIESRKLSGQTVTKWCKKNEISKYAYYYWHKKLKEMETSGESAVPVFAEVLPQKVTNGSSVKSESALVITWKDFSINVTDAQSLPMVAKLMNELVSSC